MSISTPGFWPLLLVACLGVAIAPTNSAGATIQLLFQGSVTALDPVAAPLLVPDVVVGDSIFVTLSFDSTATDGNAAETTGAYTSTGPFIGIDANIGGFTLTSTPEATITVQDNLPLSGGLFLDSFLAFSNVETPDLAPDDAVTVSRSDFTGSALSSDALPVDPESLAGFLSPFSFSYQIPQAGPLPTPPTQVIQGQVALLPEPLAPTLVISLAIIYCGLVRR